VAIDDVVGAIAHAIRCDALRGPLNVVAPTPATSREFAATLARVLGRPALFPVPAGILRLLLGEMADPLLLSSARVQPARLLASGYRFRFPDLEAALRHLLGRPAEREA
jgi:NAD dependent epimerase/dehydratase family enzyme